MFQLIELESLLIIHAAAILFRRQCVPVELKFAFRLSNWNLFFIDKVLNVKSLLPQHGNRPEVLQIRNGSDCPNLFQWLL